MIADTFGKLPRPKRVLAKSWTVEPTADGERQFVIRRKGEVQLVTLAYRTPSSLHPDADAVDRLIAKEKELGANIKFEDIINEVAGVYPKVMQNGDMDVGAWSCGMVAGLIHDVPTVKELIDRIMAEAEVIIRKRLEGFLAA